MGELIALDIARARDLFINETHFLEGLHLGALESRRTRKQLVIVAVLWRVSFYGLLRPIESLILRKRDVTFVDMPSEGRIALLALRAPKTRHVPGAGRAQFVTIRGTATTAWLEYVSLDLSSEELLWPWTRAKHYELFKRLLKASKLDKTGITPASGRAGGATHYYLSGMSLETLSFSGRWAVLSSLRSYIQESGA